MKNKKLIIMVLAVLLMVLLVSFLDAYRNDPNFLMKRSTKELSEDSPFDVEYKYDSRLIAGRHRIPVFSFEPEKTAQYTVSLTDIKADSDNYLTLNVMDDKLTDYIQTDNADAPLEDLSDTALLTGGTKCYIIIESASPQGDHLFSGSFRISISEETEKEEPEVTVSDNVVITLSENEQSAVLFRPQETGFYRFTSSVVSGGDKNASSTVMGITLSDDEKVKNISGIARLEAGSAYHIWIAAEDMSGKTAEAEVSCSRVENIETDGTGSFEISGETVIELTPEEQDLLAIYSESDGDVLCHVYDEKGFPEGTDEDSGQAITGNKGDFALVLPAQKSMKYYIYAGGSFDSCRINITRYTGDGTTLGPDDIEPVEEEQENETEHNEEEEDENEEQ